MADPPITSGIDDANTETPPGDAVCPPACGPTTDQFYDTAKLATIRITIDEEALDGYAPEEWLDRLFEVRNQCEPEYLPSTFSYESPDGVGDLTLSDVGIRARGSMPISINAQKGFKLNFHKPFNEALDPAAPRRRFADINRLNTLSLEPAHSSGLDYDATHLFGCLTFKFMRDFGVLAPQCNHLQVYVNDGYYGVMQNVEETDHGRFLAHRFGASDGIMVEASPSQSDCGFRDGRGDLAYEGDSFADYADPPRYNLERGSEADLEASMFPMFKCADETATPNDDDYKACITEWLDVDEWLRLIAAESVIPELETLGYDRNVNLYFRRDAEAPHGGRWLVSIWDVDATLNGQTCQEPSGAVPDDTSACDPFSSVSSLFGGSRLAFVDRLTRVFEAEYCQALTDFLDDVYTPEAIDAMAAVMEPGMMNDSVTSYADWQAAVGDTRAFIESNGAAMRDLVMTACN